MVVDEGDVLAASADRCRLSRSPYVLVDYIEEALACEVLLQEWKSMLFAKLACFAHSVDSFRFEGQKSDYDSLRLHSTKSLEVYVADSLVPQLDVCLGFETFGVHGRVYLVRIKDEQATVSLSLGYESAIFLDEADFNALLHDLADRDQILCYCEQNVQDILDTSFLAFFPEWDIADVPNGMRSVVFGLYVARLIRCA